MITMTELATKEVVNVSTGKLLGHVVDLDVDLDKGLVQAIIIGQGRVRSLFNKEAELFIPWVQIKKIGQDVILVQIAEAASIGKD
ncbi:YlmC/YmxH family sporulation protein [Paenalkalicoccus suaedae]|uniref:YlmC/YmxH family sporulation protein n=1 Tax=Paenalkalicoccus suaedae TaxID=2592382 RepID=A0A859FFQ4_9BACI|nr:YlmC/YmxH family sporulation protein [Paenalkalicoccus suaedae]QKS71512.1 YlmC/YmxH family sporulation protein [Paenalkalicoccus suaedae]